MNVVEKKETKDKIIAVASELFSLYGFEGTSIRDIATKSDVNVASINYHFGSKHNLYWATVDEKHTFLDEGIKEIASECDDAPEVIVRAYHLLMTDPSAIRTTMKMMLTDGVPEPDGELREKMMKQVGPPGAQYLAEVLRKNVSVETSEEALQWGVKALFSVLIHWATMLASCKAEMMKAKVPELAGDGVDKMLKHHAKAVLLYLEENPNLKL